MSDRIVLWTATCLAGTSERLLWLGIVWQAINTEAIPLVRTIRLAGTHDKRIYAQYQSHMRNLQNGTLQFCHVCMSVRAVEMVLQSFAHHNYLHMIAPCIASSLIC